MAGGNGYFLFASWTTSALLTSDIQHLTSFVLAIRLLLAAIEYWFAYGLRVGVLRDICLRVFGLQVD